MTAVHAGVIFATLHWPPMKRLTTAVGAFALARTALHASGKVLTVEATGKRVKP